MSESLIHYSQHKIDEINKRLEETEDKVQKVLRLLQSKSAEYWAVKEWGWFLKRTRYDQHNFGWFDNPESEFVEVLYKNLSDVYRPLSRLLRTDFDVVRGLTSSPSPDGVSLDIGVFQNMRHALKTCDVFTDEMIQVCVDVLEATDPVKGVYVGAE